VTDISSWTTGLQQSGIGAFRSACGAAWRGNPAEQHGALRTQQNGVLGDMIVRITIATAAAFPTRLFNRRRDPTVDSIQED
jgi:hypothetical protein